MWFRVGHRLDPAGWVPRTKTQWKNRWDDVLKEFRTSYVAESRTTALLEVFQHW